MTSYGTLSRHSRRECHRRRGANTCLHSPVNLSALTDSFVTLSTPANNCDQCNTCARIGPGLCLSCLLRSGIGDTAAQDDAVNDLFDGFPISPTQWRIGNYEILEE